MIGGAGATGILELVDRVRRSWWALVAGACLGLAGGLIVLHVTPKIYEASTKIFAASEKISRDYVRSTVSDDDTGIRLAALRESVLSRPNLENVLGATFGLPESDVDRELLVQSMRARVEVLYNPRNRMFEIRFRDENPQLAAAMVNELAGLYIEENRKYRSGRAEGATEVLGALTEDALREVREQEAEVARFRSRYPLLLDYQGNVQLLRDRRHDLEANEREQIATQEQLQQMLAQQRYLLQVAPTPAGVPVAETPAAQLRRAREELKALEQRYSPNHPDVTAKRREVDELERRVASAPTEPEDPSLAVASPELAPLQTQIDQAGRRVERLRAVEGRLRAEIVELESRVQRSPEIQRQLEDLTRGLTTLQAKYDNALAKLEAAKSAEKIEATQEGAQFEVIEPAIVPRLPVQPQPIVVLAIGLIAGLVLCVAPIVTRAFLRPVIASAAGLTAISDVPLLVLIPSLETPKKRRALRLHRAKNLGLCVASMAILALVVVLTR